MITLLQEHLGYLSDHEKIEQFRRACGKVIQQGDRIADLGCGTGILGLLALKAGANHAYEIDETTALELAREAFQRADFQHKATFIGSRVQHVDLHEPVDVVLCDHIGYFGIDYGVVSLLKYAKQKLLKPQGHLIPRKVNLEVAGVSSEACRALAYGWQSISVPEPYHWLNEQLTATKHAVELNASALITQPAALGEIDFYRDHGEYFSWQTELVANQAGTLHGLGGWFHCELADDVWMTNSPLSERPMKRSQVYLPTEDIPLRAGERLKVMIMARPDDSIFAWTVELPESGRRISNSTWRSVPMPSNAATQRPGSRPRLNQLGRARQIVLSYCDGTRTSREIMNAVGDAHPDLFPTPEELARFINTVLSKDTEPLRVCRRLQLLRDWSYDESKEEIAEIFA